MRDAAILALEPLFGLAAPAADALHTLLISHPELRVRRWQRGAPTLGGPLKALARCGDARAVPMLAEVLDGPDAPDDLGHVIVHLGQAAAPLAPALRQRLTLLAAGSPEAAGRAVPLLSALGALRDERAVPHVLGLLKGGPVQDTLVGYAVRTLASIGAAAHEAVPELRGLLDTEYAVAAAGALWSVGADESLVLPVLLRELARDESRRRRAAAEELGRLGPAASAGLPALRRITEAEWVWERTAAACALWRVGGDAEPVIPVLRSAWQGNAHTRVTIAACLADMSGAAAAMRDLVEAELTEPRRHAARPGGHGDHDIPMDEELLRLCRELR